MEKKRTRRVSVKCCVCAPTYTPMQRFSKITATLLDGIERTLIRGTDIKREYCGKPNNIPDSYCYVHILLHDKSMNIFLEARVESI